VSWRRVAAIYMVLALLAGWVLVFDRAAPPAPAPLGPAPAGPSILEADAAAVTEVTLRREGRVVRAARHEGRWGVIDPAGAIIPPDLIEATIATLTAGQSAERLASAPEHDLAAYGLDVPSATMEIALGATPATPVTIAIGSRNPTHTAVYARRSDQAAIYLVGLNLSYYIDLIFDAAKS
jgi:hypothetical protein